MNINSPDLDNLNYQDSSEINKDKLNRKISCSNSVNMERAMSVESAEMFFNGSKEKEFNCDNLHSLVSYYKENNEERVIKIEDRGDVGNYSNNNKNCDESSDYLKENIKSILSNLYRSYQLNKMNQMFYIKKYDELSNKQILIEETIEKIKKVSKSKQKKHVKYLRYIPLSKIYYYSPKKTHFYYIFMDIVVKSRKKSLLGNEKKNFSFKAPKENKIKKSKIMVEEYEEDDYEDKISDKSKNKNNLALRKIQNRFKFNPNEDEIFKKIILYSGGNCINWYQIACDFNEFISTIVKDSGKEPNYKPRTPLELFARSLELSDFYLYKKWNSNEDLILKKAILYYGPKNWQQISYCLDGRNNSQCFHRWMKGINPKIKRSKWSFEEDLTLGIALRIYGNKKWSKIANHLEGRTDIQCRERFCNILDPSLEEVDWTYLEDIKLLMLYDRMKNKWSKIAKDFGNRTDNTCWRRWKYLESLRKSQAGYPSNITVASGVNRSLDMSRNIYGVEAGDDVKSDLLVKDRRDDDDIENNTMLNIKKAECNYEEEYPFSTGANQSKKKIKKKNIFLVRKITPKETIETSF